MDPRPVSAAVAIYAVLVYLGAVAGLLFAQATPPLDVGALSTLVVGLLFGVLGFALLGRRNVPA